MEASVCALQGQTLQPIPPISAGPGYQLYALTSNEGYIYPDQLTQSEGWICDVASPADITFAQTTWGGLLVGVSSVTAQAQILGKAIINALEGHRGVPSEVMDTLSPFDQYRRAIAGDDEVWCSNIAAIFTRACTCFGIPARIIALSNVQTAGLSFDLDLAPSHATTEIYDPASNSWVWIDLTFYMLGMQLAGDGLINAAELQRSINDPVKVNLLTAIEYVPSTQSTVTEALTASDQFDDLQWYFMPITVLSLYRAEQYSGLPTYLQSNEDFIFPINSNLTISAIQGQTTSTGISVQLLSGMPNFANFQWSETYSSSGPPLLPVQTSSSGLFQFSFSNTTATVGQAVEFSFVATDTSGHSSLPGTLIIYYYSPAFYAQYGSDETGQMEIDMDGFSFGSTSVANWIVDVPQSADVSFAVTQWGGVTSSGHTPTQNAQAIAQEIINSVQGHTGQSSILPGVTPFAAFQAAVSGGATLGSADVAGILAHACNCLGIPARMVGIGSMALGGTVTDEIFDNSLNRWVWLDPWDSILGISMQNFGLIDSAEIQRCFEYTGRLANLSVINYNPALQTTSSGALSANAELDLLTDYFGEGVSLLYEMSAPIAAFPLSGTIVPGYYNGGRTEGFLLQNNAGIPLYTGTGSSTTPFQTNLQWWTGSNYSGWGDSTARIVTGDFNGDGKTDFILHDSHYGALFTATGNPGNPFTITWLWTPSLNSGGWTDPGAVIVAGDFNGDGKTDFIIHNSTSGAMFTATGNVATPFAVTPMWQPGVAWGNWGDPGAEIIPGNFMGSGRTDFIIHDAKYAALYIATGKASAPFTHTQLWNPSTNAYGWADGLMETITTGDFNGDGRMDFIVQDGQKGALYTATGNAAQPFTVTWLWAPGVQLGGWGDAGAKIVVGDFNGDGKSDFIIYDAQYAAVFYGTGNPVAPFIGNQLWNPSYNPDGWATSGPVSVIAGDFNGDGKTDFIVTSSTRGALYTATGNASTPFAVTWLWGH